MYAERELNLGGEWFDGSSGTNSQSRCPSREKILERIEIRRAKRLMLAALEEIEREKQDERVSAFKAEMQEDDGAD
jgi:hypothetical protein